MLNIDSDKKRRDYFECFVDSKGILPPDQYFFSDKAKEANRCYDGLIEIVSLFSCLVTCIMGDDAHCNITKIERYTLLFLTKIHSFDMSYRTDEDNCDKNKKPKLYTMPNLLSLLNIPNDIKRFGNLRLVWELAGMGEGFFQRIKKHIPDLQKGFAKRSIDKFLRERGYSDLAEDLVENLRSREDIFV